MKHPDQPTEYIVLQADYDKTAARLPATGTDGEQIESAPVMTREYRQNMGQGINAGKWVMWGISPRPIPFTWQNGAWQPPANLVIRRD